MPGRPEAAVRLFGASEALERSIGAQQEAADRAEIARGRAAARAPCRPQRSTRSGTRGSG